MLSSDDKHDRMPRMEEMVNRFLSWKLPEDFHPDAGISFKPEFNVEWNAKQGKPPERHQPIGTNLFTATQALAMLRHVLNNGCDCPNPRQCWEPCGELGHSAEHAKVASPEETAAIDAASKHLSAVRAQTPEVENIVKRMRLGIEDLRRDVVEDYPRQHMALQVMVEAVELLSRPTSARGAK